jgi:hypothetical protein
VTLVSCCYLAALAFPFGWWARGVFSSVVAVATLLVNAFVVPQQWSFQPPGALELLALAGGVCFGIVMARKSVQRPVSEP